MKKLGFIFSLFFITTLTAISQTVIYSTNFGSAIVTSSNLQSGWVVSGANPTNLSLSTTSVSASYTTPISFSAGANLADGNTAPSVAVSSATVTVSGVVNTTGYSNVQVIFAHRRTSAYTGTVLFEYSTNSGVSWNALTYSVSAATTTWSPINGGVWLDVANAADVENLQFRFTFSRTNTSGNYRIDDFTVRGIPSFPSVSSTGTLGGFLTQTGSASPSQTFSVSGVNLTNNVVLTAPSGYELSLDGNTWNSTLNIIPTSGVVTATSVQIRMTGAATGQFIGNVSIASTGATTATINAQGISYATPTIFGVDNVVVLQAGSGALQANGTAVPILLREFTTSGAYVQTVPVPFVNSGSNYGVTMSNSGTSEGALNLSGDAQRLTLVGYNAPVATSTVSSSSATTYPRVAIVVYNNGTVNTSTIVNDAFTGNNVRSSVTQDGTGFWMAGAAGGVRYVTLGSTGTSTSVSNNDNSVRVVSIVDGQLWCTSNTTNLVGLSKVGIGLPTTSVANTLTIPSTDPYAFQFLDANSSVPGSDLLYIANNTSLIKMSFDGTTWVSQGSLTGSNITGVCAKWDAATSTATIYATNGTGLWKLTDNAGATSNIVSSGSALTSVATNIATAITNTAFRGVSFAPSAAPSCNFYPDADADGYGTSTGVQQFACNSIQAGYVEQFNTDCNDASAAVNPAATELPCNSIDDNCNTTVDENFVAGCNDPSACNYNAAATCNVGCDFTALTYYQDLDADGYGSAVTQTACVAPVGYVLQGGDCDDNAAAINPGATENLCNDIDDNCNASVDEGGVEGCTDPNAGNYNASATCNVGCTYNNFTPGNIVALRVGSGAAALSSAATAMFLDEIATSGVVQTVAIPTTGINRMVMSGSSTSEGHITRSQDFSKIAIAGYDAALGLASVNTAANVNRAIGTIGLNSGTFTRVASANNFFLGNNFRSACVDGTNYWGGGTASATGGVNYFGTGTATNVSNSPITNVRVVSVQNNQLYFSTGSSPTGIYSVGSGTPTTSGVVATSLISTGTGASPYAYQFSLDGNTCYIADDRTNGSGGIQKWINNAGTWSLAYTVSMGASTGARGVAVDFYAGAQPKVYAVSTTSSTTKVVVFNDNGTANPTLTTLLTPATNTAIRSIAFAPCTPSTWYADADGDGYGALANTLSYCTQPYGYVSNSTDCNDAAAISNPAATEICDGIDNDCNGTADNGLTFLDYYTDADGDTYGAGTATSACSAPVGMVLSNTDCNDAAAISNPAATEICDGLDNDCNGTADNGLTFLDYYTDADGDTYGAGTATSACSAPVGMVLSNTDCNDAVAAQNPGATDICNNTIDEDCSGADCVSGINAAVSVSNIGQFGFGVQSNVSVNLAAGTNTVESPGIGNDVWYSFQASGNAVRIALTGATGVADDNDLGLYSAPTTTGVQLVPLVTENDVTIANVASLSTSPDAGSEVLYYANCVPGQIYYVCVRNNNNTPGTCSLSISFLRGSQADILPFTGGTGIYNSTCANFKAAFRSQAAGYVVKRWADQAQADEAVAPGTFGIGTPSWTFSIPPQANGTGYTICQLGKILPANLTTGLVNYYVTVDVNYNLTDAAGNSNTITAFGTVASQVGLNFEAPLLVRSTDLCSAGSKRTTAFLSTNRSVCGTARYDWKFKQVFPAVGLPTYVAGGAGATRLVGLSTLPGIAIGQRYDVWIRAAHLDGNSFSVGTAVGLPGAVNTWFPTTGGCTSPTSSTCAGNASCVKLIGNAGMTTEEGEDQIIQQWENDATVMLFPNPNNGQQVNVYVAGMEGDLQVRVTDATGKVVLQERFVVEGSLNTALNFQNALSSGLYQVEMNNGSSRKTLKMSVVR